jgi:hypothetical protein
MKAICADVRLWLDITGIDRTTHQVLAVINMASERLGSMDFLWGKMMKLKGDYNT